MVNFSPMLNWNHFKSCVVSGRMVLMVSNIANATIQSLVCSASITNTVDEFVCTFYHWYNYSSEKTMAADKICLTVIVIKPFFAFFGCNVVPSKLV